MSAPATVRAARASENATVAEVLTDAFVDEGGMNYWLRQDKHKTSARRKFFDLAVGDGVHPQRELWMAESDGQPVGSAIWLGPNRKAYDFTFLQELQLAPMLLSIAGISGTMRGLALAEELEKFHPQAQHAHLVFLGVATSAQGKGVGSAMLKAQLAPVDAQHLPAYLETSSQRNVDLYARHGFEVTGEFDKPGLHMWTMTRPAR
ncbi:MAG: GNAT family N-acetyltransferase [Terricaulis sp.]